MPQHPLKHSMQWSSASDVPPPPCATPSVRHPHPSGSKPYVACRFYTLSREMCVWTLPKLISSIWILYKNLFLKAAKCDHTPFGFYTLSKQRFSEPSKPISPIWIFIRYQQHGFSDRSKPYQPHLDFTHFQEHGFLEPGKPYQPYFDPIYFER